MNKKSVNVDASDAHPLDAFDGKASSVEIGRRLAMARDVLGLTQEDMATKLGGSARGLQNNERGISAPNARTVLGAVELGINANWLLTGEGEMLLLPETQSPGFRCGENPDYLEVPLFDVRVAAGHGAFNDHERQLGSLAFRRDWVRKEIGTPPDKLALVYVHGDSMEPELREGDVVMVDRSVQDATRDGIYVLMLDDHPVIKRLQRLPDRKVRVSSANPAYQAFVMDDIWDDADHWIVGRAVWSGRRL